VPGVGSLGVESKSSEGKSVTRTAPPVTAAMAAARLIRKFADDDEGVVDLTGSYLDGFEYRTILEGLQKRGVMLSANQKAQLERLRSSSSNVRRFD